MAEERLELLVEIRDALRKLNKFEDEAKESMGGAEKSTEKLSGKTALLQKAFVGLAAAIGTAGAARAISQFVKSSTQAAITFENFENALKAATGSASLAQDALRFVSDEAERLGIGLEPAVRGFTNLTAAARGTALEGEELRTIFSSVSEAASVMGLSASEVGGVFTAFQQIISKGRVSTEELRRQLGDRLPGAFQIAARAMGVTTQELDKMLETGQLVAEDLLPAFAEELRETFGAGVQDAVKSTRAEIERVKNEVLELQASFGRGFAEEVATGAGGAAEALDRLGNVAAGAGERLGQTAGGLLDIFSSMETLGNQSSENLINLSSGFLKLADAVSPANEFTDDLIETLDAADLSYEELTEGVTGYDKAQQEANKQTQEASLAFELLNEQVEATREKYEKINAAQDELNEKLGLAGNEDLPAVADALVLIGERADELTEGQLEKLKEEIQAVLDEFEFIGEQPPEALKTLAKELDVVSDETEKARKATEKKSKTDKEAVKSALELAEANREEADALLELSDAQLELDRARGQVSEQESEVRQLEDEVEALQRKQETQALTIEESEKLFQAENELREEKEKLNDQHEREEEALEGVREERERLIQQAKGEQKKSIEEQIELVEKLTEAYQEHKEVVEEATKATEEFKAEVTLLASQMETTLDVCERLKACLAS